MGVPVVTTPAVAEGVSAQEGSELQVTALGDGGARMADAVCALLADPVEASRMAARARVRVETDYGWAPRAAELTRLLTEAASTAARCAP